MENRSKEEVLADKEERLAVFLSTQEGKDAMADAVSFGLRDELKAPRHEEQQYLDLMAKIVYKGVDRPNRTGTDARSIFTESMRFDLTDNKIPLFTTKKVYWKAVVLELLWFINGQTDSKILEAENVNIWKGNSSREYLDKKGLEYYDEGECGPIYGFQWRNFNGPYRGDPSDPMEVENIDQLARVLTDIKNNPNSRYHIVSAWNPQQLQEMALPPCHMMYMFYVANGELSCTMIQRSCDTLLGVPFNVASYALLTHMVAQVCGLKAKEFNWVGLDVHLYKNHFEQVKEQISREPRKFPTVELVKPEGDTLIQQLENYKFKENIILHDYDPHPAIKAEMAI